MTHHRFSPLPWIMPVSFLTVVTLLAIPGHIIAQVNTSTIVGTVSDVNGAVVPGAAIAATNAATGLKRSATAGSSGDYAIADLPTGTYTVTVSSAGFQSFEQDNILLQPNSSARVDAHLAVGNAVQTVVVTSAPPLLETTTNTVQTVIDQQRVTDLPLNGRNPLQLTLLVPGVNQNTGAGFTESSSRPEQQYVSANGGRGDSVDYLLDGQDNNDMYTNIANVYPNPDALQEFTFQTNNYSAEYGWRLGGVVNAVTDSGTNRFHGTVYEYLRNAYFNGTNYFTPGISDGLKRNQFGASVGGPIFKNKLFFFADFQGTTIRQTLLSTEEVVPTATERNNGNFSSIPTQLVDPSTGMPFAGNQIPTTRFDPVAVNLLKYIPIPTNSSGAIRIPVANSSNDYQYTVRIDDQLSNADRLTGRYLNDELLPPNPVNPTDFLGTARADSFYSQNLILADSHIFSPSLLMTGSVGFNRIVALFSLGYPTTLAGLGSKIVNLSSNNDIYMTVTNYFSIPTIAAAHQVRNDYDSRVSVDYTHGAHNIVFGAELIRQQFTLPNVPFDSDGDLNFSSSLSGNDLVDFMLGAPSQFIQSTPQTEAMRAWLPAIYVNDNYRITHTLTLNMGLRYQPFLPWVDQHNNQTAVFLPGAQSTLYPDVPTDLLLGGDPGVGESGYSGDLAEVDPRFGLAWQLRPNLTFRGGLGLFHDYPPSILNNEISLTPPYAIRITIQDPPSIVNPFTAAQPNPFPTTIPPPSTYKFPVPLTAYVYDPHFTNSRAAQYNASLEWEFRPSWLVTVGYIGGQGAHLLANQQLNAATYIPGASSLANVNQRRPYYPNWGSVSQIQSTGISNFNGWLVQAQKRFNQHWSLLASYTLSRSSDLQSDETAAGVGPDYTNPFNPDYDYADSDFDVRNRFVASALGKTSSGAGHNAFFRYGIANWEGDLIATAQSGPPFTVYDGINQRLDGLSQDRPNMIGNPHLSTGRNDLEKVAKYFNTAAYQLQPLGSFGDTPRNSLRAPGYSDIDMALVKTFPVRESINAQFRAEAFNVLNEATFMPPNATLTSALYGQLTSANPPRVFQFALRVNF